MTGWLLMSAAGAWGADRYVWMASPSPGAGYTSWNTASHTITGAVAAASAGETVWITNGTYDITSEIVLSGIKVRGMDRVSTIVNGGGVTRCFNLSGSSTVLDNLTISNGYHASQGGGIYMSAGTLINCTVVSNSVPTTSGNVAGGGLYLVQGLVSNCAFARNFCAYWGGAVYMQAGLAADCLFTDNIASNSTGGFGHGGGISHYGGAVRGCTFIGNASKTDGGAVRLGSSACVLSNCTVVGNCTAGSGGGVSVLDGTVRDCLISSNAAAGESGGMDITGGTAWNCRIVNNTNTANGAAVSSRGGSPVLYNCLVAGNTSPYGGVFSANNVLLTLENCTVVSNKATLDGGGVFGWQADRLFCRSSIIYFNTDDTKTGSGSYFEYCCASDLTPGLAGNINANPRFLDAVAGDYHLAPGSPCINTGTNRPWMIGAVDLAGVPRILQSGVDMGAYEWRSRGTLVELR